MWSHNLDREFGEIDLFLTQHLTVFHSCCMKHYLASSLQFFIFSFLRYILMSKFIPYQQDFYRKSIHYPISK
ncbi:hypothetical protein DESC_40122 [Desulfosarcina cetonica]|nr:hypothetical protein DESC_40122 [Desulfosarcina cetonica]